jgi:hypothetical protein
VQPGERKLGKPIEPAPQLQDRAPAALLSAAVTEIADRPGDPVVCQDRVEPDSALGGALFEETGFAAGKRSCSTTALHPPPAAVLYAADPHALDHCAVGHVSAEPGHRRLLEQIGQRPLFDFGMRLGEGSGATLAFAVLKAAVACHNGMATFAEARVSGSS